MNGTYSRELQALRYEIETGGARPSIIDACVDTLLAEGGKSLAADLLLMLSDKADNDDGMFTLVHAAESLDVVPYTSYISALLTVFPTLFTSSPRWASIVLMRVINSDVSRYELVGQLRSAPVLVQESVRAMCDRINEVSPEFLSKTVSVNLATS